MSVKVTCKYKKDPIKTAEEKWQHRFPHYKSMGYFSDAQGQLTPQAVVGSGRTSNPPSFQACPRYLQYKKRSMGAICCHGNQTSYPIWPKT